MTDNPAAPAIWSALAASFAALSSFLIMLIQRRTLLESARPELVLEGWARWTAGRGAGEHEVLGFKQIRNVGRGAAFHLYFQAAADREDRPLYVMSTIRLPILPSGDAANVSGEIALWWKNVTGDHKHIAINLFVWCWDAQGRRHETQYRLFAVESPTVGTLAMDVVAPGVALTTRTTIARPVWWLKLLGLPSRARDRGRALQHRLLPKRKT